MHPKVSPAFKTGYDAYIFPNNTSVGMMRPFLLLSILKFHFSKGEFVGLMFDETISPDIRQAFEDILSKYSVLMAQQGTPTVRKFNFYFIYIYSFCFPIN